MILIFSPLKISDINKNDQYMFVTFKIFIFFKTGSELRWNLTSQCKVQQTETNKKKLRNW